VKNPKAVEVEYGPWERKGMASGPKISAQFNQITMHIAKTSFFLPIIHKMTYRLKKIMRSLHCRYCEEHRFVTWWRGVNLADSVRTIAPEFTDRHRDI
jgi:hypothetical protein